MRVLACEVVFLSSDGDGLQEMLTIGVIQHPNVWEQLLESQENQESFMWGLSALQVKLKRRWWISAIKLSIIIGAHGRE